MNDEKSSDNSPSGAPRGAGIADAAGWAAAAEATKTGREQLAELLSQREVAEKLEAAVANLAQGQREGHVFEWMHEVSFNLSAIAHSDEARLRVTRWIGEGTAPDDLRLFGADGEVLQRVQAKVVDSQYARLASSNGLSDAKYSDMTLLTPAEHAEQTQRLLEKRLSMPEGPYHERYESVSERITDRVEQGDTSSEAVKLAELKDVSDDPTGYLKGLLDQNAARQITTAGFAAGAVGALVGGAAHVATARIRTGSFDGLDWIEAGRAAAIAGVSAGTLAAGGQTISVIAQHAIANSVQTGAAAGTAASALAGGTLPLALARATFDVAAIGHGVCTGKLTGTEAAIATAESITTTSAVWACGAVGQTLIPVPLVGYMVGAMVGQFGAATIINGVRIAVAARDIAEQWDAEYEALLEQADALQRSSEAELAELHEMAARYDSAFTGLVLPRLDRLAVAVGSGAIDEVLNDLTDLTRLYGGAPIFQTMADFDLFMSDERLSLDLDMGGPNRRTVGPTRNPTAATTE